MTDEILSQLPLEPISGDPPPPEQPHLVPVGLHPVDVGRIREMATALKEPNLWLMRSVAAMVGMESVENTYQRTLEI